MQCVRANVLVPERRRETDRVSQEEGDRKAGLITDIQTSKGQSQEGKRQMLVLCIRKEQ